MPRGCQGAKCQTEFEFYGRALTGMPLLHRYVATEIKVAPSFVVAINAVTQAANGQEDYRFLPEFKGLELAFTDFRSWFSGEAGPGGRLKYQGEVVLNAEWGRSTTSFTPLSDDQPGFFPAYQNLSLFFQFRLDLPGLLSRRTMHIFNKEPMRFITEAPLDGFPPMDAPDFVSLGPVEMYDVADPDGQSVGRFGKGRIVPIANVTYEITGRSRLRSRNTFDVEVDVSRSDGRHDVMTAVLARPFPGCEVAAKSQDHRLLVGTEPATIQFVVKQVNAAAGEPGVFIRVASIDTEHLGFGRADVHLGADLVAAASEAEKHQGGTRLHLDATRFGILEQDVEHIWISPHGFRLEGTGASPECVLPVVDQPKEVWFTHFTRGPQGLDGPHVHLVRVTP